ncbi:MAG: thioesterase II family protein [Crocinitomicaceae bacterium]
MGEETQLFLLHFAGGNRYSFQFLKSFVPNGFSFCPIELPGRGKRMSETLLLSESAATEDLVDQIIAHRNTKPYVLFGHSMGASLAIRVAKKMESINDAPTRLVVAGNSGPGTSDGKKRSTMTDPELKEELLTLGGVEDEVIMNDELFNFFSPILRADFGLLENARTLEDDFKVAVPIRAVMGTKEEKADKIENWKRFTSKDFNYQLLEGNHFFIHDHPAELIKIITDNDG